MATAIQVQPIDVGVLNLQGGELLLVKVPPVWQMPGALEAIKDGFDEALAGLGLTHEVRVVLMPDTFDVSVGKP